MANYLMPGGAVQPLNSPRRSRSDIIYVDNMHKIQIYNKSGTITFDGFVPPEFTMSLQASWNSPYANTSMTDLAGNALSAAGNAVGVNTGGIGAVAGAAGKAIKLGGASSYLKAASAKVWSGPSYLVLSLPLFVDAYADTKTEVIQRTVDLLSLATPSEGIGGILIPPGPIPLFSVLNEQVGADIEDKESFTVQIGKYFKMSPVVINSVTATIDNALEDTTGQPISCDFVLQIASYFAVTREDLREWFGMARKPEDNKTQSTGGESTP